MIERRMLDYQSRIESWFRSQWRRTRAPFYASVDIRNAGFKVAPVDTNLFPAGFNNLNPAFEYLCVQAIQLALEHSSQEIDRILIVPENHSRNLYYLENLAVLQLMIEKAGFATRIGSIDPAFEETSALKTISGYMLRIEPVSREGDRVAVDNFMPDLILLNNDLSLSIPGILQGLSQPVTPALELGWSSRLKSDHFTFYRQVVQEFSAEINIDPWLIEPMFRNCGEVNFMQREGVDCLSNNTRVLLKEIKKKYQQYDVDCDPFVIVKADAGTYGMGVMTIHDPDEIGELNRRQRTRMSKTKEGHEVTKVIIQEGVYTRETWGEEGIVAEPVVYMIAHHVVGGFYRVHSNRTSNENLNAPGMRFEPLAFESCCISPHGEKTGDKHNNRFYTYGVVARLALLAAAREMASFD